MRCFSKRCFSTITRPLEDINVIKPKKKVHEVLSFTKIDTFMTCPLRFKYRYLLNIPQPTSPHAILGKALHAAIAEMALAKISKLPTPSYEVIYATFLDSFYHEKNESNFSFASKEEEDTWITTGNQKLQNFYNREIIASRDPLLVETQFEVQVADSVHLIGVYDRADIENGDHVLIEFKTQLSKYRLKNTNYLQLKLYLYAYEKQFGIKPTKAYLTAIDTGDFVEYANTADNAEYVENLMIETSKAIKKEQFQPKPSTANCRFCPYNLTCPSSMWRDNKPVDPTVNSSEKIFATLNEMLAKKQ